MADELDLAAARLRVLDPPLSDPPPGVLDLTDTGNAARLIALVGDSLRYVHRWGTWLVYLRGRWVIDTKDALVSEMAKGVAEGLLAILPSLEDAKERKAVFAAAERAKSAAGIRNMIYLARAIDGVIVDHEDLDANPDILNCLNGTIELRTETLRLHDPADLCTKQAPVHYDPAARAPQWEACLKRWHPDAELRAYLGREVGAAATGRPTETLSIHHGDGANGKSKFWGAVQHVLGPYAVIPHKSLLIASRHEQHPTTVAKLFRARLAVASETAAGDYLDDESVKNLTGSDRLSGRRMKEDFWEFNPSHSMVMFSNHEPIVRAVDEGLWRRLRLVPWSVIIPEAERDEELAAKLEAESSGILNWVVAGGKCFYEVGLAPPEAVKVASAQYRVAQDTVSRFLSEVVVFRPTAVVRSSELVAAHEAWANDAGIVGQAASASHWRRVTAEMTRRGATAGRAHGGRNWSGVDLLREMPETRAP